MRKNWLVPTLALIVGTGALATAQPPSDQPTRSTDDRTASTTDDHHTNFGWIGLLGLAGLFGLRGRPAGAHDEYVGTRASTATR